jgi:uncharacterized repeat protein (TIGR03833 family)
MCRRPFFDHDWWAPSEHLFQLDDAVISSGHTRMNGRNRADIKPGARVRVVQKKDQRSGKLTEGTVRDILTNSAIHPRGIKVRLTSGVVGRVKEVLAEGS